MNYPAASGRGIRIKIDSIVDFGVAAGILGSSLLGMVRQGGINRLNPYLAKDLTDQLALDQKQLTKIVQCLSL